MTIKKEEILENLTCEIADTITRRIKRQPPRGCFSCTFKLGKTVEEPDVFTICKDGEIVEHWFDHPYLREILGV